AGNLSQTRKGFPGRQVSLTGRRKGRKGRSRRPAVCTGVSRSMNQPVRIARPLTTLLALSLLLTGCFGRGPKGPQPPQTFEVIGSVRSLQPGEPPISGAQVTVNGVQAATDEFGNFALAKVPRRDGYPSYFASAE